MVEPVIGLRPIRPLSHEGNVVNLQRDVDDAVARLDVDPMPPLLPRLHELRELSLQILTEDHARIEFALVDCVSRHVQSLQPSVALTPKPGNQRLADRFEVP